jgi:hypothetical protein
MNKRFLGIIFLFLLSFSISFSQTKNTSQVQRTTKRVTKEKVILTVHLRNGDIISGVTNMRTLSVSTAYGQMAFPLSAINSVKVGIKNPEIEKETITQLVDKLSSLKPEDQRAAFNNLVQQEPGAICIIKDYMNTDLYTAGVNPEYSAEAAIQQLYSNNAIDEREPTDDVIRFDDNYSIMGTCNFIGNLQIENAFGVLEISRKMAKMIEVSYESPDESVTKNFMLPANKNISGNADAGFLNTGITIKAGTQFSITANGTVTIASLSNNMYTPDGGVNGGPAPNDGGTNTPTYGNVVFKIGENGQVLKAGAAYKGKATTSGVLMMAIYETVFNPQNTGAYKVKVKVME